MVGDLLNEFDFHASDGGPGFVNVLAVGLIGGLIFRSEDEDLACQATPVSVHVTSSFLLRIVDSRGILSIVVVSKKYA